MFWNTSSLKKASLVCDIGSASVGMALVDFSTPKPTILFSARVPISIQKTFELSSLEPLLVSFFDESLRLIEKAQKSGGIQEGSGRHVDAIHLFFSSPWYAAKSTSLQVLKEKPFLLDQHGLEELIAGEEKKFQNELLSSSQASFLGDMVVIERELLTIRLNGYETLSPFLKKATDIEMALFMSVVPHRLMQALESKIIRAFHAKHVFAHAFPLAGFRALKHAAPLEKNYLFLDIAGEMTDAIAVQGGIIASSGSFSFGRNSLIRALGKGLGVPLEVAVSFLATYSKDGLDEEMKAKIEVIVRETLLVWRDQLEKIVKKEKESGNFSQKVFVTVDDDVSAVFLNALKNATGDERGVFQITTAITKDEVAYAKHATPDPFISLEALSIFYLSNGQR